MGPNRVNQQQNQVPPVTPSNSGSGAVNGAPQNQQNNPKMPSGGKRTKGNSANSTQNMLQIAEIRDGIVIMNDGSYRSVIMAKPVNFDLMSMDEKQAVEFAYQGFLNALYFPIQVFIHSEKVDLGPYLERLQK